MIRNRLVALIILAAVVGGSQSARAELDQLGPNDWSTIYAFFTTAGPTLSTQGTTYGYDKAAIARTMQADAAIYLGRQEAGVGAEMSDLLKSAVGKFREGRPAMTDKEVLVDLLNAASE